MYIVIFNLFMQHYDDPKCYSPLQILSMAVKKSLNSLTIQDIA